MLKSYLNLYGKYLSSMTTLLSIEAASDSCSIALQIGQQVIQRLEPAPRMHSRLLYPMLNSIMSEAGISPNQLDAIAFVNGPGSFTGLRIAAATAQGMGFACDTPLIGISTLQAMAQQEFNEHRAERVISLMDARMNELYLGYYEVDLSTGIMVNKVDDCLCPVDVDYTLLQIPSPKKITNKQIYGCGHGFKLTEKLSSSLRDACFSVDAGQVLQAKSLLPLANTLYNDNKTLLPEEIELVYLREQSHWKTIKQQKLLNKEK
jgi:tRNA threonylcarbamoyladenosine biosynthesis protein TsaB